jgi:hypothetical protein
VEASLGFHPHLHILVSDGCFHKNGMFSVSPAIDAKALEQIFRHKVLKMLLAPDFILFMDEILTELTKEREVHVILDNYCTHKNKSPRPFIWKKREVKGSQLRDTIDNLCY